MLLDIVEHRPRFILSNCRRRSGQVGPLACPDRPVPHYCRTFDVKNAPVTYPDPMQRNSGPGSRERRYEAGMSRWTAYPGRLDGSGRRGERIG